MKKNKEVANISFTKFVDTKNKTAKSYALSNGELTKNTNGSFWNGSFKTINIEPSDLPDFIESMVAGEFLIQGVHQSLSKGNCPEVATRLKDTFPFADKPGFICIDTDSAQEFNINSLDELNDVLEKIEPCLAGLLKVMSTSASSYISVNGKGVNGLRGIHTFIPIDTTKNNKTILETLHVRAVNAGYGYPKITKAGIVKINSVVDKALCTSNQPIYEGGAILEDKSITQTRLVKKYNGKLLSANSISPLTEKEIATFEKITVDLTTQVAEEAQTIRQNFIKRNSAKLVGKKNGLEEKNAASIIKGAINSHDLYGQFLIHLETGEEITVQNIIDYPQKYHLAPCAHPLDDSVFGKSIIYADQDKPAIHTFAHGGEVFFLHPKFEETALADWEVKLNDHVSNFNKTHAQVMIGGKHKIMRTIPVGAHQDCRVSYEFINQEELRKIYANDLIQVGKKIIGNGSFPIMKDKITAWAKDENCSVYRNGVIFSPAKKLPPGFYNTWQGFTVKPLGGACTNILKEHIELIICSGDRALIEYFYNWIAYTMQHPDRPAGSALILRGEKGSGKGTIGHFLRLLWGNHSIHISNAAHLVGKFNGHLADLCFLFADEAFYSGDKQHEGVLKALITDPTITIERKGIDAVSQPNYLKVLMVTNSDYAVPATKDERRYCVFDVASKQIGNKKYFDALNAACGDKAVQSSFLYEMLGRDIDDFNLSAIPESRGLKDQRLFSLKSHGNWLVDSFAQGYFSISYENKDSWEDEVPSKYLYESYKFWCDSNKITHYDIVTKHALGKYLAKIFINKKLKGDIRGFVFGTLRAAILAFENYEKVKLNVDVDEKPIDTIEWDEHLSERSGEPFVLPDTRNNANPMNWDMR